MCELDLSLEELWKWGSAEQPCDPLLQREHRPPGGLLGVFASCWRAKQITTGFEAGNRRYKEHSDEIHDRQHKSHLPVQSTTLIWQIGGLVLSHQGGATC